MTPHRKKRLTYVTIGIFFLLQGVEYAVILPTLWLYIEDKFHSEPYMLGLVLSAFSFSGLLSSPLMGRWSDLTHNTKVVLLVANLFQIIGSIMYFIGLQVWFLVGARLVAGIGSGVSSALFGDIARVTSVEERTSVMSMFMAVRQIGLLLGPACNLFLRRLDFSIGPFIVDKYTSPGVFMAALWIIHEILSLTMYWNLPALKIEETLNRVRDGDQTKASSTSRYLSSRIPSMESPFLRPSSSFSINSQGRLSSRSGISPLLNSVPGEQADEEHADLTVSNDYIERAERFMCNLENQDDEDTACQSVPGNTSLSDADTASLVHTNTQTTYRGLSENRYFENLYDNSYENDFDSTSTSRNAGNYGDEVTSSYASSVQQERKHISWHFIYQEFIREEVIALLFTSFVSFFNQVGIETLFTPLSKKLLNWGELENSYLYCGAGAEVIIVFFLVRFLSKRISDRWLLLGGFLVLSVTIAVATWFIPQATPDHHTFTLVGLLLLVLFDVFALPFLAVTSASLYSKITRKETQGFAQGVRQLAVGLSTILAPLWAGALLNHLTLNFAVMLSMIGLGLVMLAFSFKYLKEDLYERRKQPKKKSRSQEPVLNGMVTQSWDETQNERQPLLH